VIFSHQKECMLHIVQKLAENAQGKMSFSLSDDFHPAHEVILKTSLGQRFNFWRE